MFFYLIVQGACQRFALLAGGRAWTKLRERDSVRAWKMLENAAESHPSSVSMKAQPDRVAVGHVFGYAPFVQ